MEASIKKFPFMEIIKNKMLTTYFGNFESKKRSSKLSRQFRNIIFKLIFERKFGKTASSESSGNVTDEEHRLSTCVFLAIEKVNECHIVDSRKCNCKNETDLIP